MRAFILRPFGQQQGIDFDSVEAKLIAPALTRLNLPGRTTGEVIAAGNLREETFQRLLVSDLVVADLSIDDPKVYYELGIRHALRQRRTFLIRARGAAGDVPFDLRTDRTLTYDPAQPEESVDALYEGLKAAIASERQDSPVFRRLPELREPTPSTLLPVPRELREEVEQAVETRDRGKLALLAYEVEGAPWASAGLRLVGRESGLVGPVPAAPAPEGRASAPAAPPHVILFTGHQVDAPGRPRPRFPPEKEPLARTAIRAAVERVLADHGPAVGMAGAASGGDILFHEVCAELGVPARLYLALPPEAYVVESVAPAGGDWVARFHAIASRFPDPPILSRTLDLPGWLRHLRGYSIWQRNNLWVLNEALASSGGAGNLTLIALWNGEKGDGPGGTEDMIRVAEERGAAVRILPAKEIFGLPGS